MREGRMNRFLDLADFERAEIVDLLSLAERLKNAPERRALAGKILGVVFFNPSLRTLASFQAALAGKIWVWFFFNPSLRPWASFQAARAQLGGSSFVIAPGQATWQLETRR